MEIDFAKLGGPVYVGRANGAAVRALLKLDALDAHDDPVIVSVPEGTYSVNSSFFLGMFGPSISLSTPDVNRTVSGGRKILTRSAV